MMITLETGELARLMRLRDGAARELALLELERPGALQLSDDRLSEILRTPRPSVRRARARLRAAGLVREVFGLRAALPPQYHTESAWPAPEQIGAAQPDPHRITLQPDPHRITLQRIGSGLPDPVRITPILPDPVRITRAPSDPVRITQAPPDPVRIRPDHERISPDPARSVQDHAENTRDFPAPHARVYGRAGDPAGASGQDHEERSLNLPLPGSGQTGAARAPARVREGAREASPSELAIARQGGVVEGVQARLVRWWRSMVGQGVARGAAPGWGAVKARLGDLPDEAALSALTLLVWRARPREGGAREAGGAGLYLHLLQKEVEGGAPTLRAWGEETPQPGDLARIWRGLPPEVLAQERALASPPRLAEDAPDGLGDVEPEGEGDGAVEASTLRPQPQAPMSDAPATARAPAVARSAPQVASQAALVEAARARVEALRAAGNAVGASMVEGNLAAYEATPGEEEARLLRQTLAMIRAPGEATAPRPTVRAPAVGQICPDPAPPPLAAPERPSVKASRPSPEARRQDAPAPPPVARLVADLLGGEVEEGEGGELTAQELETLAVIERCAARLEEGGPSSSHRFVASLRAARERAPTVASQDRGRWLSGTLQTATELLELHGIPLRRMSERVAPPPTPRDPDAQGVTR